MSRRAENYDHLTGANWIVSQVCWAPPTVMFSKSRCLLCTVSHSFLIFSLTFSTSFAVSWSWWAEWSWSSSSSLIISSRQALSRSMLRRSRLRMYMRAAVHRARFWKSKSWQPLLGSYGEAKHVIHSSYSSKKKKLEKYKLHTKGLHLCGLQLKARNTQQTKHMFINLHLLHQTFLIW